MRLKRNLAPALAVAAALAAGCAGGSSAEPPPAQTIDVSVTPATTKVGTGGAVAFAAAVTGTVDTRVTWSVVEPGGGTIDPTGVYTAPSTPGGYHVNATSVADSRASGQSAVTVVLPVLVSISPRTPSVVAGRTVTFTAAVSNATDTSVTWAVAGTSCGTITQTGVYTAPAAAATCTVTATSHQDPTRGDSVRVTVTAPPPPVTVALTPSPAAADACKTVQFSATVTNAANGAVTWSVREGATGGTVSTSGLFTAPATGGTYHVVATSVADPTATTVATVTVTERVLSVAVAPATTTVQTGGTAQFTATVTTTCGAFASTTTLAVP